MSVPIISIVFMGVSAILSIGVPVGLFLFFRRKYSLKIIPMLVGMAAFVLFALVLESIMHQLVLKPDANGNIELRNSPILFMLYGGFAAGVFEETARFLSFSLLKKKYKEFGTSLSYGIGHGGVEAVLLAGIAMISNIIMSIMLNLGAQNLPGAVSQLVEISPPMFLMSGVERMMALTIHISLSVIVWYAVIRNDKRWLYPIAILLHAIVDFVPALSQTGVISNVYLVECVVLVCTVFIAFIARYTHSKIKKWDENSLK